MQFQSFLQETSTCTKALIDAQVDKCAYVTTECADQWDYLNFIGLYYCDLNENLFLGLLICFVFVIIALQFLGTTADAFLAESLDALAEKLKISDAVAGVTFLALANGASDVISGIVAGGKSTSGVLIATGGLLGACLFTVTIVFARCIQGAEHIKIIKSSFLRDSGFILIALVYFFIIASIGPVSLPLVCVFFVIYAVYFAVVVYQQYHSHEHEALATDQSVVLNTVPDQNKTSSVNKPSEKLAFLMPEEFNVTVDDEEDPFMPVVIKSDIARGGFEKLKRALEKQSLEKDPAKHHERVTRRAQKGRRTMIWNQTYLNTYYHQRLFFLRAKKRRMVEGDEHKKRRLEYEEHKKMLAKQNKQEEAEPEEEEEEEYPDNLYGRFMFRYDQVLLWVRQLTMPQFDEENYNKWMAFAPPVFGLLFSGWILGILPASEAWVWYTFLGIAVALEILIFIYRNHNLAEKAGGISSFFSFIISVLWIELVASSFMDMLALLTIISGLPLNFLSLTLLAWGNSMDDYFIDYSISKRGKGSMAITGVFGGQLFNLLIGLGGSLFRNTLSNGPISFNLYAGGEGNVLNVFLLICTTVGMVLIIAVTSLKKFEVGKAMMWFMIIFYLIFLVGALIISTIE